MRNIFIIKPGQCLQAATAGLDTHCVEPSPKSFQRIESHIKTKVDEKIRQNIHLYNVAAGPTSGDYVDFSSSGGTGDHIGKQDMWAMTENVTVVYKGKESTVIKVPTMRLDDIVFDKLDDDENGVFVLKVGVFVAAVEQKTQQYVKRNAKKKNQCIYFFLSLTTYMVYLPPVLLFVFLFRPSLLLVKNIYVDDIC